MSREIRHFEIKEVNVMFKQAWRSYIASLHPRYLKKAYNSGATFMLIYWFVIYPLIMNAVTDNLEFYDLALLMLMRMLPSLIMSWSNISSKYLMPKEMYLCPMNEHERKEYINDVLFIKIGVSVLLGMCIEVIWGIFMGFYIAKVIIMLLVNFSIGIVNYITTEKKGFNNLVVSIGLIIMVCVAFLEIGTEGSLTGFCNWFIVLATVSLPVLDIILIRKKYQPTIALAGEYELAFKVEGKVEPKQVEFNLFAKKE